MVDLFKRGEYASDAAPSLSSITLPPPIPARAASPRSPRTNDEIKQRYYRNPPFNTMIAFEYRHLDYAPSETMYLVSKQEAENAESIPRKVVTSKFQNLRERFESVADRSSPTPMPSDKWAQAVYGYQGRDEEGELSFEPGDVIALIERRADGWWLGRLHGQQGVFPCNYTRPAMDIS
mmetsp:Transcript_4343/g.8707  ORF Transcript_4343/g.8707 Transcript_4343/m.8707 type:complete len:178 (-) Transcript_4343:150-683(-)